MLNMLQISKFLYSKGWSRDQVTLAMMHIYSPFHLSILRTKDGKVSQGGHGVGRAILFDKGKITKNARCRVLFAWMFTGILRAGSTSVCVIYSTWRRRNSSSTLSMQILRGKWKSQTYSGSVAAMKNATTARSWFSPQW